MKWIKFETNFWDSETCDYLEKHFSLRGVVLYLRLLATVGREIHTIDDLEHVQNQGWTKSLKDWSHCTKSSTRFVEAVLLALHSLEKVSVSMSSTGRYTVKFKNIHEFVSVRALSSKYRASAGAPPGAPTGAPLEPLRREEKRKDWGPTSQQTLKELGKSIGGFGIEKKRESFEKKRLAAQALAREFLNKLPLPEPTPLNGSVGGEFGEVGEEFENA